MYDTSNEMYETKSTKKKNILKNPKSFIYKCNYAQWKQSCKFIKKIHKKSFFYIIYMNI